MGRSSVTIPQIDDDETVEQIDGFLTALTGWVLVFGNIDDKRMALRVGGYRCPDQKPLVRGPDPNETGDDFVRTHYSSMTFQFEREAEAHDFFERFG